MLLEGAVRVVHVSRVVLVVVDLHRLRVDVRLERVERVWKRRNLICHGGYSPLLSGCDLVCETRLASLGFRAARPGSDRSPTALVLLPGAPLGARPRRVVEVETLS